MYLRVPRSPLFLRNSLSETSLREASAIVICLPVGSRRCRGRLPACAHRGPQRARHLSPTVPRGSRHVFGSFLWTRLASRSNALLLCITCLLQRSGCCHLVALSCPSARLRNCALTLTDCMISIVPDRYCELALRPSHLLGCIIFGLCPQAMSFYNCDTCSTNSDPGTRNCHDPTC